MRKNKSVLKYIITGIIAILILCAIIFVVIKIRNRVYPIGKKEDLLSLDIQVPISKQSNSKKINIDEIITKNEENIKTEIIERQEIDIEFTTQYRQNESLAKGKMQTIQEGEDGRQDAIIKKTYQNGEIVSSEQISSEIKKVAIDKIVEIGTAQISNNYVPIVGDQLKVTSNILSLKANPGEEEEELTKLNKGEIVVLKARVENWYYVSYNNYLGWVPMDCVIYVNPNGTSDGDENNHQYTKEELSKDMGFSMLLNKKSELTIDQFKQVLENDENDRNNIFTENAEYFYYVEDQYNLNGLFVAAVAIHESGWGTSEISKNKKNLFGYGAYDRDPYGSSYKFETFAEGIDLVSRVFVKYYINMPGTNIYNGEKAIGTYYRGATLTAVNKSYASDKNWANGVYRWMMYLYNKL